MSRLEAQRAGTRTARKTAAPARRRPVSPARQRLIRLGLPGAAAAAVLMFGVWAFVSGWAERTATEVGDGFIRMTVDAGFSLQEVLVTGRSQTDKAELLAALGVGRGDPILRFDPKAAQGSILALPWIKTATVERRLPDTIFIRLEERRPMALWQNDRRLKVIDQDGQVLTEEGLSAYADLPMIVGPDAPEHAPEFLALLAGNPTIAERVEAAVRVGGRRWDLKLENGVDIRLPEDGVEAALTQLSDMAAVSALFERDIIAIDLRITDRLVIQTSPFAAERRRLPEENT
ncbi:MAG TPA: cell division protein FtsQ/DivIB [Alphaproteobacteria bacterium]|nr:cell division protein FtsQ/DivIB [Alphaproteobacteria bacterium]